MHGSENRQRGRGAANRLQLCAGGKRPIKQLAWLTLAVTRSECERQWMKVNLGGSQWTPANGFEDRGAGIHRRPSRSATVRMRAFRFQDRPRLSAGVREVGCLLGCQRSNRRGRSITRFWLESLARAQLRVFLGGP